MCVYKSNPKRWIRWGLITAFLIGLLLSVLPTQPVMAEAGQPPADSTVTPGNPGWRDTLLERSYQLLLRFKEHIGKDYDRIPIIAERTNQLIARLTERGQDPAPLPQALETFLADAVVHRPDFEHGSALLATHSGFDENGKVIDRNLAAQTVNQVRQDFQKAHRGFHDALQSLRQALRDYRSSHNLPAGNPEA